jgi:hypothetical protein
MERAKENFRGGFRQIKVKPWGLPSLSRFGKARRDVLNKNKCEE